MNFQSIPKVENADFLLDVAFREGKMAAERVRSTARGTRLEKAKEIEIARMVGAKKVLHKRLETILRSFPSFDNINEFYLGLLKCYVDIMEVKRSLAAVAWARGRIEKLFLFSLGSVKRARELERINGFRREFYGRASSIIKQIKDRLPILEKTRYIMKNFPLIKERYYTVALAGFPNVGKTTLLSKLSGSTPEIKEYAFTTKSLNLGYIEQDDIKVQLIDTPGTLNRFDKMNDIEKQAYLAIKCCAQLVVYVFDITEPYPLEHQKRLLETIAKFEKPTLFYLSKTDILEKKQQVDFRKHYPVLSLEELRKELVARATEWQRKREEIEAQAEKALEPEEEDDSFEEQ